MLLYEKNGTIFCYIHIPKNSGKFHRQEVTEHANVLKSYWGTENGVDLAHIPYMYVAPVSPENVVGNVRFYAHTRNPYNRVVSAFFYLNHEGTIDGFKELVVNELASYVFDDTFPSDFIHYYPQYMFVYDKDFKTRVKTQRLEDMNLSGLNTYDRETYFNDEVLEIINRVYRPDFEKFGYDMIKVAQVS